jgi:FtsP/CotA-like multicopper oxidase with cupredoxin domain
MHVANAAGSSIYVQCPESTDNHPNANPSPGLDPDDIYVSGSADDGSQIKCDHLSAGDGVSTMADDDGKFLYIFGFDRIDMPDQGDAPAADSGNYPSYVMDQGTLAANTPAPTIIVDEDDEYFLNVTNTGMIMRPDLFDPHTIHWHGFPNASAIFDGLPDTSISVNMGATLTYYYLAKDAGTYMYHCHVEATEHMQMGMLGNLFVRPRQNRCDSFEALEPGDPRHDLPGASCPSVADGGERDHAPGDKYAYNDGDGSTYYDVDIPIQLGSFDPDFHDASFSTQPLPFAEMRDRYYLLNGRGYPDTVKADGSGEPLTISTIDPLGRDQLSQPVTSLLRVEAGQTALLRISNLSVTEVFTVGVNGLPMEVVALDARLLRDDDGGNMYYKTNSITIGGGQSADVLLDTSGLAAGDTIFFYSKNLDKLANDDENLGGMMTEIRIVAPGTLTAAL